VGCPWTPQPRPCDGLRYSDELIQAMNEYEAYSPDDSWLVFADRIDELLNELAAGGTK
jgi:hypothetical protein